MAKNVELTSSLIETTLGIQTNVLVRRSIQRHGVIVEPKRGNPKANDFDPSSTSACGILRREQMATRSVFFFCPMAEKARGKHTQPNQTRNQKFILRALRRILDGVCQERTLSIAPRFLSLGLPNSSCLRLTFLFSETISFDCYLLLIN